ncbi:MAG TPA: dienelactone hydrolase family protein [Prolixibacteraceae bacterium]|nr:dienelactone hydrolase family protein [Prolixibacteraceae bacterium]
MSKSINDRSDNLIKAQTNRRQFIKKSVAWAGGSMIAFSLLRPSDLMAQITDANDSRLTTADIQYKGASGQVLAYMARPKAEGKYPAIIVIHENRGLQPHIKDVTRRFALEGFIALAPDALSAQGGTPATPEEAGPMFQKMDYETTKKDFVAAVDYLKTNPLTTGKVGCTGFCWGGAMTNQVAVNSPQLNAGVPYYGSAPKEEDVPKIKASMMLHYAGDDERINQGIAAYEAALKKAGVDYKLYMYEGAQHAFNNDSNPQRYNKEAADLAWQRTIEFFKEKLQ